MVMEVFQPPHGEGIVAKLRQELAGAGDISKDNAGAFGDGELVGDEVKLAGLASEAYEHGVLALFIWVFRY